MELDAGDLIALLSFLAACLAAVYAKATVKAAERANEIELHSEKLKTYKGIVGIQSLLRAKGIHFSEYDFWIKYEYVELTEFYFNKALAQRVAEYFDLGKKVVATRGLWEEAKERGEEERKAAVQRTWNHFNKCIELGDAVIEGLKTELRLH